MSPVQDPPHRQARATASGHGYKAQVATAPRGPQTRSTANCSRAPIVSMEAASSLAIALHSYKDQNSRPQNLFHSFANNSARNKSRTIQFLYAKDGKMKN